FQSANATAVWIEIPCSFSSSEYIVSAVPSRTLPCRRDVPVAKQSASMSVVFPEPPWPSTATLRIRSEVYSFATDMKPHDLNALGVGANPHRTAAVDNASSAAPPCDSLAREQRHTAAEPGDR